MGRLVFRIIDHTGEASTVTVPTADLTVANIDTEYAAAITIQDALDGVSVGKIVNREHTAKSSPQGVGKATDPTAQRENKALLRAYDSVTFGKISMEIPCPDLSKQVDGHAGTFYDAQFPTAASSEWQAFVTAIEANVKGPGGNALIVESVVHVGRNL